MEGWGTLCSMRIPCIVRSLCALGMAARHPLLGVAKAEQTMQDKTGTQNKSTMDFSGSDTMASVKTDPITMRAGNNKQSSVGLSILQDKSIGIRKGLVQRSLHCVWKCLSVYSRYFDPKQHCPSCGVCKQPHSSKQLTAIPLKGTFPLRQFLTILEG